MNSIRSVAATLGIILVPRLTLAQEPVYELTDIGPVHPAGIECSVSISARGLVAASNPDRHVFLWDDGSASVLPDLEHSNFSYPCDLADSDRVVGFSMVAVQEHAAVWVAAQIQDLGTFGGISSMAFATNESGQVVGSYELGGGGFEARAFLWDLGNFTDLGGFGGNLTRALGINEAGVIVGGSRLANSSRTHAFVWSQGTMTDIGSWAGSDRESIAQAINDAGAVVGILEPLFANGWLGFLYENGTMSPLPALAGADQSIPIAINNLDQIVGQTRFQGGHEAATLFQGGLVYDLNALIVPGSGWELLFASDINDEGQIVGVGLLQGEARAFRLEPHGRVARYCVRTGNSVGTEARILATGPPSIAQNDFELVVAGAVPGEIGSFFYGQGQRQLPFGDGFLCVGSPGSQLYRLGRHFVCDANGSARRRIDFPASPTGSGPGWIQPATTWSFQCYYRDAAGPGGSGFNLSDAIAVRFAP